MYNAVSLFIFCNVLMNLNDLLKECVIGFFCVFLQKLYKTNEYETCEERYKLRLD